MAPITPIDGDKLLDLLTENGVGVRTKTIDPLELDTEALDRSSTEDCPAAESRRVFVDSYIRTRE